MIPFTEKIVARWRYWSSPPQDKTATPQLLESWEHISTESLGPKDSEKLPPGISREIKEMERFTSLSVVVHFPIEIWHKVIDYTTARFNEEGERGEFSLSKSDINALIGLASASKFHRCIVLEYWTRTFFIREHKDPIQLQLLEKSNSVKILSSVRRLVCGDDFKIYQAPADALDGFSSLFELVIDGHSDIDFGNNTISKSNKLSYALKQEGQTGDEAHPDTQQVATPRMAYRRLKVKFPATLRVLRIYNSHVPDLYLIQKAARECPKLQVLTVARCTLFTRASCQFWDNLPRSESDAYFSNHKVTDYAAAVGKELAQLPALETAQIGVYLTDHAAIKAHVEQHAGLASLTDMKLSDWRTPCSKCIAQYRNASDIAEKEATAELAKAVPRLTQVSWLSFCSETRTSWHPQYILRHEDGRFSEITTNPKS